MSVAAPIGIRWTLGDVGDRGFEALRLSVWGAWRLFGPDAAYVVCVNNLPLEHARGRTGEIPSAVTWRDATEDLPPFLLAHMDEEMAEGVAWKLAPPRMFPDRYELSFDNDCILWDIPPAVLRWLDSGVETSGCLMAEDVRACFGRFTDLCGPEPRNAGIRGLPPGFDFEAALRDTLRDAERRQRGHLRLTSELDEQGLQTAALSRPGPPQVVPLDEVTVCSPFHPHLPHLGRCGAHFVGLNARHIPWDYFDRPADEWMTRHWTRYRDELAMRVGVVGVRVRA